MNGKYYIEFKDGQKKEHCIEINRELYNLLNVFELEDLKYLNVLDRHIEQSEIYEVTLHKRSGQVGESAEDEAGVNNTVEIYYEDDGSTETIKLVTTVRGDSLEGYISIECPLGKALLGHKVGDRVLVEVNDHISYYVVIKSIQKTDDSGDKIQSY